MTKITHYFFLKTIGFFYFWIALHTNAVAQVGATTPFKIYEAENATLADGATLNTQIGIPSASNAEFEASGRTCVQLDATNESLSWTTTEANNAIVVWICIPDAFLGGGIDASINLYVDGVFRQTINTKSKYTWTYGTTGSGMDDDNPATGTPKRFYESCRAFIVGAAVFLEPECGILKTRVCMAQQVLDTSGI